MKIAVDAMGGDYAPDVVIQGAVAAARDSAAEIILVGQEPLLREKLAAYGTVPAGISVIHADEVIAMEDSPAQSVRKKKNSSINVATKLVKEKKADAIVSAGNTGAVVCSASLYLRNLAGVERPGIGVLLPTLTGMTQIIDAGANIDARPVHLLQYAIMGSVYSSAILHKPMPRVGLLNIGEEESKGTEFIKEAFRLLEDCPQVNFIGNVEGRDIYEGRCDVIVCEGFIGNVVLKVSEGLADAFKKMLRRNLERSWMSKLGALLAAPAFRSMKKETDYSEYGGAPLLGVDGVCIIAHGGSTANAIKNAIRVARESVAQTVNRQIIEQLQRNTNNRVGVSI